jgi:predicted amidohydrolase YtcJ
MFVDNAMERFASYLAGPEGDARRPVLEEAARLEAGLGWTGVHNMSVPWVDVEQLEALDRDGKLAIRVYNAVDLDAADPLFEHGPRSSPSGLTRTPAVKIYMDGALGSRGAALLADYADESGNRGVDRAEHDATRALFDRALASGVQLAVHAIGDRATRSALDWMAEAFAATPPEKRAVAEPRWRIEHAQIVDPADIPRFAELGVIASMQPSHAIGDLHFAPARLGQERLAGAYAWRDLRAAGAVIAGGSDAPVERGDPLIEFYAAVARRDLKGFQGEGWHPEQALDRSEALALFTLWPAYASHQEDELGTIEVGKRADLTAFSGDLMTLPAEQIPLQRAVLTMVGGEIPHDVRTRDVEAKQHAGRRP